MDFIREPGQPAVTEDGTYRSTDSYLGGDKPEVPKTAEPVKKPAPAAQPSGSALEGIIPAVPATEKPVTPAPAQGGSTEPATDEAPVIIK